MSPPARYAPFVACTLLAGCGPLGEPDGGARDGAARASTIAPPQAPGIPWLEAGEPDVAPPDIPWRDDGAPPLRWDCPAGWRQVEGPNGVTTCDPYPSEGARSCPAGQAHFPGEEGCAPIGRGCGREPFASVEELPEEAAPLYARTDAAPDGDGSRASPYRTLAEALDAAEVGSVVLLGSGTYELDRPWPDGVSLRGRCVRETSVVAPGGEERSAVFDIARHDHPVRLESVAIGPAEVVGIAVRRPGERVHLEGIEVREATGDPAAVSVRSAAMVEARSLVVRDTRPVATDGSGGSGIRVEAGGRLTLERAVVERSRTAGIGVIGARTIAQVRGIVIRDTQSRMSDQAFGSGLEVIQGARLELSEALLLRNRVLGLGVSQAGAEAALAHVVIRDTQPQESDDAFGRGLGVSFGGRVEVDGGLLERNHEVGVEVGLADATLRDVVIRDTLPQRASGRGGRGLSVQLGGHVELVRAVVDGNRDVGIALDGEDIEADLTDVLVARTREEELGGCYGRGLGVQRGASATLTRVWAMENREYGLLVASPGSEVTGADVVIDGTRAEACSDELGDGIAVSGGSRLTLTRVEVAGNRTAGVSLLGEGTEARLSHLVVRDTLSQESTGRLGRGLSVVRGARLTLDHARVERNRTGGLVVSGPGAEAVVEDIVVRDVMAQEADGAFGRGISGGPGSRLELTRALVEGNREGGLILIGTMEDRALATVRDLVVRETAPVMNDGVSGSGVIVQGSATLDLARGILERNHSIALALLDDAVGRVTDLFIRETLPRSSDGHLGIAVSVEAAELDLCRGVIEASHEAGIAAFDGARIDMADLEVRDTVGAACLPECDDRPRGTSIGSYGDSRVSATGFILADAQLCGVQLAVGGEVDLADGTVRGNPIGACLQDCNYAVARLQRNVEYPDNGVVLECGDLPAPDAPDVLP